MLCPKCGATLPEEGKCLSCGEARSNQQAPPSAGNPRDAKTCSSWRELSPIDKAISILIAIPIAVAMFFVLGGVHYWVKHRNAIVIENQSGQTITTATVTLFNGPPEKRRTVQFRNVPADGKRSWCGRLGGTRFGIEGRFADGRRFSGAGTTPSGRLRIVIGPDGVDFGKMNYGKPAPARAK